MSLRFEGVNEDNARKLFEVAAEVTSHPSDALLLIHQDDEGSIGFMGLAHCEAHDPPHLEPMSLQEMEAFLGLAVVQLVQSLMARDDQARNN